MTWLLEDEQTCPKFLFSSESGCRATILTFDRYKKMRNSPNCARELVKIKPLPLKDKIFRTFLSTAGN